MYLHSSNQPQLLTARKISFATDSIFSGSLSSVFTQCPDIHVIYLHICIIFKTDCKKYADI